MVRPCCVSGCQNNKDKISNRRYVYRFPRNQDECNVWLKNIPNEVQIKLDSTGVCSRHWPPNAQFTLNRKIRRPIDPPTVFVKGGVKHNRRKQIFPKEVSQKLEFTHKSKRASKKNGPYSLRKVKLKNYDLMMKGIMQPNEKPKEEPVVQKKVQKIHEKQNVQVPCCVSSSVEGGAPIIANSVIELSASDSDGAEETESVTQENKEIVQDTCDEDKLRQSQTQQSDNPHFSKGHYCHYCHSVFAHEHELLKHRQIRRCTQSIERRLTCYECQVEFHRKSDLIRHVRQHTSWGKTHLCLICREKVAWKFLYLHLKQHRSS